LAFTPKYSCISLFRIPAISRHRNPGLAARTHAGILRAASPMISSARIAAY
jgi:hypothetical protein